MILPLAALLLAIPARSQQSTRYSQLWKVTGKGLPAPSFLFGTMHNIGGTFVDSFPAISRSLAKTKVFVCEALPSTGDDYSDLLHFPANDSLQRYMTATDFDTVMQFFRSKLTGEDTVFLAQLPRLKPQAVNQLILEFKSEGTSGNAAPAEAGLDDHLKSLAGQQGMRITALETIRDQVVALSASAAVKDQASKLAGRVSGRSGEADNQFQLDKATEYRSRRIPYHFDYPLTSQFEKAVAGSRNKKWMEKIPAIIAKEPAFIAVGNDHLISEEGLIMLLRNAGYKVTNIPL